jgi:hypothetical protein
VTGEIAARRAQQRADLDAEGRRAANATYLAEMVKTGEFPLLQAVGVPPHPTDQEHDATFASGLEWLFDGIAGSL